MTVVGIKVRILRNTTVTVTFNQNRNQIGTCAKMSRKHAAFGRYVIYTFQCLQQWVLVRDFWFIQFHAKEDNCGPQKAITK